METLAHSHVFEMMSARLGVLEQKMQDHMTMPYFDSIFLVLSFCVSLHISIANNTSLIDVEYLQHREPRY